MQLSYNESPANAYPGLIADAGVRDVISKVACSRQLEQVVVTTEANSENFTITINGTAYTYASDTAATKAEITAGLKALIDAGGEPVEVTDDLTDTLLIESTDHDAGFTISVSDGATGVLTLTSLVSQEQAVPFGTWVCYDERVGVGACRLPRVSGDVTNRKLWGIAIADASKVTRSSSPEGGYSAGQTVPIIKKGRVWVTVEDVNTVAPGGLVYVRFVASGSEQLGASRAADDGSDTDPVPNAAAVFTGKVDVANNLAEIDLNLP